MTNEQIQKKLDLAETQSDVALAQDLVLCITNNGDLYRRNIYCVIKNLQKHIANGRYDHLQAVQAFYNTVLLALSDRSFYRDTCYALKNVDVVTRYAAALGLLEYFQDEINFQGVK